MERKILHFMFLLPLLACLLTIAPATVNAAEDLTPPELIEFSYTPDSIDTSTGPATVTFTMRITDDISGYDSGYIVIYSPSGGQSVFGFANASNRISGDAMDGIYEVNAQFPQYGEVGTWHIWQARMPDKVANLTIIYESDLISMGFPTIIEITGAEDLTPPELVEFSFTPDSIDTSSGPATVTFIMRITDDISR